MNEFKTFNTGMIASMGIMNVLAECFETCNNDNSLALAIYFKDYTLEVVLNNQKLADGCFGDAEWDCLTQENHDGELTGTIEWDQICDARQHINDLVADETPCEVSIVYAY